MHVVITDRRTYEISNTTSYGIGYYPELHHQLAFGAGGCGDGDCDERVGQGYHQEPSPSVWLFLQLVGVEDADVVDGTVVVVGLGLLDAVDHIETLGDFAKHGVLSVEMRHTTHIVIEV